MRKNPALSPAPEVPHSKIPMKNRFPLRSILATAILLGGGSLVQAATFTWNSTSSTDFNQGTNWTASDGSTGALPATTGTVYFDGTGTQYTSNLTSSATVGGLRFGVSGYTLSGNTGTALTIGSGGITYTYTAAGTTTISANLILAGNQTFGASQTTSGNMEISGNISESSVSRLSIARYSRITLSGSNSFSGGVTAVNSSTTLNANNEHALGTGTLTMGAGTFGSSMKIDNTSGSTITLANNFSLNTSSTTTQVTVGNTNNLNFSGQLILAYAGINYLSIAQGTSVFSGGIVDLANSGKGFAKSGAGTLVLASDATYTGDTIIVGGTLQIGNASRDGSIASPNITGSTGSSLVFYTTGSKEYDGNILGNGTLFKRGSGTQTLAGLNSYTGATTVEAGKLVIDGSIGTGAVTVQSGATLSGSGSIGGAVTVQSGGRFSPGTGVSTTLTTGNLTLSAGSTTDIDFGTASASHTAADSAVNNDRVSVNGALVLGGTLNLADNAGAGSAGQAGAGSYLLFTQTGAATGSFAINNIAGYHAKVDASTSGRVYLDNYQIAAASTNTTVNVGITHKNQSFQSKSLSVTNNAASNGYAETLEVSKGSTTGAATVGGNNITGLAGGQTDNSSLTVSLSPSGSVGAVQGTVDLTLASNGAGTSGYGTTSLGTQTVTVVGQVNDYANPVLQATSGLTQLTSTSYLLDLGTVNVNNGTITISLAALNELIGTAAAFQDALSGSLSGLSAFTLQSGSSTFSNIAADDSTSWTFAFDTTNQEAGTYTDNLTLTLSSVNTSETSNLDSISLALQVQVVPEPATWAMIASGLATLVGIQRFRRNRVIG